MNEMTGVLVFGGPLTTCQTGIVPLSDPRDGTPRGECPTVGRDVFRSQGKFDSCSPHQRRDGRRMTMEGLFMPAWSRTTGPALQRHAEDAAALVGELHDRDPEQELVLAWLAEDLRRAQTLRTVDRERGLVARAIGLQQRDTRDGGELLTVAQSMAGAFERRNRPEFEANKRASETAKTSQKPKGANHDECTTQGAQLALFGEQDADQ